MKIEDDRQCKFQIAIKMQDGSIYQGQIQKFNGHYRFQGQGSLTFSNGDLYDGEWKNGQMHGSGVYTWKVGNKKFEGSYEFGYKQGPGKMHVKNGALTISGNW